MTSGTTYRIHRNEDGKNGRILLPEHEGPNAWAGAKQMWHTMRGYDPANGLRIMEYRSDEPARDVTPA